MASANPESLAQGPRPSWFVGYPVRDRAWLEWFAALPPAPAGLRVHGEEDLHVTLAFLGDVGETRARAAFEAVAAAGPRRARLVSEGFRWLGHPKRPSALVVGDGLDGAPRPGSARTPTPVPPGAPLVGHEIRRLRRLATDAAGAPAEDREVIAHVTLARRGRTPPRVSAAWTQGIPLPPVLVLEDLVLYTAHPDRPRRLYRAVQTRPLCPPGAPRDR